MKNIVVYYQCKLLYRAMTEYLDESFPEKINDYLSIKHSNNEDEIPINPDIIYIILFHIPSKLLTSIVPKSNIYILNSEQIISKNFLEKFTNYINNGYNVIDYCDYHLKILKQHINNDKTNNYIYLPAVHNYDKQLTKLSKMCQDNEIIHDVAICSMNSAYRENIVKLLEKNNIIVNNIVGFGDHRDIAISKCKILLNIHYDSHHRVYESIRCDRWILAGKIVVTEDNDNDNILDVKDLLISVKYNDLVDKIIDIVHNYDRYYSIYRDKLESQKDIIIGNRHAIYLNLLDKIKS